MKVRWLPGLVFAYPTIALAQAPAAQPAQATAPATAPEAPATAAPVPAEATAPSDAAAEPAPTEATEVTTTAAPVEEAAPTEAPAEAAPVDCPKGAEYQPWTEEGNEASDWVFTATGEWIRGTLKEVRAGALVFGSDKFGDLNFGWDDIVILHSPKKNLYVTKDYDSYEGTAEVKDGKLVVTLDDGSTKEITQTEILNVTAASTKEIENWDFKATLGITLRQGNTETFDYAAFMRLRREDSLNRMKVQYDGQVSALAGDVTANKHLGQGQWDLFVSRIFYVSPFLGDILFDEFQNFDTRWSAGAGAGAHVLSLPNFKFDLEAAGAYIQTNYISVEAGEPERRDDAAVKPKAYVDWKITPNVDWETTWTTAIVLNDVAYTYHHAESRLSVNLTDIFTLMYAVIYDRQETPTTREDGTTPVRDDIAMTLSLGVTLD